MAGLGRKRQQLHCDTSLGEAFDAASSHPSFSPSQPLLKHLFHSTIEQEYAAEGADLSLWYWDDAGEYPGADVILPAGLSGLVERLAERLDIRRSHIVSSIEYDQDGVRVLTDKAVFSAEYAVISLPLGVLKNGSVTFSPGLPQRKLASIQKLTMGVLNKLFLRFPKCFWPTDSDWIEYMDQQPSQWAVWFNYFKYTNTPILMGFSVGAEGRSLENLMDQEIVASGMNVLRRMFGATIPAPVAWRTTRWASDPFSFGSYSHTPPGASGLDYDALAQPVQGRLFFAGEATHRTHYGSVHGAFLSGVRAAKQIETIRRRARRPSLRSTSP
jgi:monoamine oxidase